MKSAIENDGHSQWAKKAVQERYGNNVKGMKRDVLQSIIDYVDREGENTHPEVLEQEALGPV